MNHKARHLTAKDIPLAFPLLQLLHADATLSEWEQYAWSRIEPDPEPQALPLPSKRGIVIAENAGGYLQGMFSYTLRPDAFRGPALHCDQFVALDLIGVDSPLNVLLEKAEHIARDCGGARVDFHLSDAFFSDIPKRSRLHQVLCRTGHQIHSFRYGKALG